MKRKIVQHGSSSLTITLPIKWAEKYHLRKGDDLTITEEGSSLRVTTDSPSVAGKKIVKTSEFGLFTKNNLTHLYQLGYDDLEIHCEDGKSMREIRDRVHECIGYEIIDQKGHMIHIRSIANTLDTEFDMLLRKAFLVTKEIGEGVLDALTAGDMAALHDARSQEFINNKYTMCCVRILHKYGRGDNRRLMQIFEIVKYLEKIADEYKYICDLGRDDRPVKLAKQTRSFFKNVNEYFTRFYAIFYKFDPQIKEQLYVERRRLNAQGEQLLREVRGDDALVIHYLLNVVQKTYDASGEYYAMLL